MKDLRSLTYQEVEKIIENLGEAKFRVRQLYPAVFKYDSLDEITTLSKDLRRKLSEEYFIDALSTAQKQTSKKDGTIKFLFRLSDGNFIESVFMKYHHGNTLCVSSQVGCLMGCKFCASTIGGKVRDLTPGEIISQIIKAHKETGESIYWLTLLKRTNLIAYDFDKLLSLAEEIKRMLVASLNTAKSTQENK